MVMLTVKATINTIENIVTTLDRIGFSSPVSGKIFRTFIRTENLNRHCKSLASINYSVLLDRGIRDYS